MQRKSEFVPITVSVRPAERRLIDQAAQDVQLNRSEFLRLTVLPAARAIVESAHARAGAAPHDPAEQP